MLSIGEANTIQECVGFWLKSAERKVARIEAMVAEGRELSVSEQADVEYLETRLPARVANAKSVLEKIKANAKEATTPVDVDRGL